MPVEETEEAGAVEVEEFRKIIIKGVEYSYEVSNMGNVRRIGSNKNLKLQVRKDGRVGVGLWVNKVKRPHTIHRLVATAFIENKDGKPEVDHVDCNTKNNKASNLRWASRSENASNIKRRSDNTSGFKGVSFHKRLHKFHAQVFFKGKNYHVGYFDTASDAFVAYKLKAEELHGEFARF